MEVYQLQASHHLVVLQELQRVEQLGGIEAELADVSARFLPFAGSGRRQFDSYANGGRHVQTARHIGYQLEFVYLLYHDEDAASHLLCQQRQFHIVLILVSVADYDAVLMCVDGQYGVKFRL